MAKKRSEPRKLSTPTPFEQARDELFSHILRCGVLEATPEHQKEWFDDTMLYLADRYAELDEPQLTELRLLGERYCRPVDRAPCFIATRTAATASVAPPPAGPRRPGPAPRTSPPPGPARIPGRPVPSGSPRRAPT